MISVEVATQSKLWKPALKNADALVKRVVGETLDYIGQQQDVSVGVALTDDAHMRELNHLFRGKNKPTNVLSFPGDAPHLGDIALAFETLAREAKEQKKSFTDHVTHMLVHGTLHLCGFNHEADDEAEAMEMFETQILKTLGIADPYML